MGSEANLSVADLNRAITNGHLVLWYQPKVRLNDFVITGAEALVRWVAPDEDGFISPGLFLPLAERYDVTPALTMATTDLLVKDTRRIRKEAGPLKIAYNVSARDIQHADVVERIIAAVERKHLDPQLLELELTETSKFSEPLHFERRLRALQQAGISMAMDDFGTGHSNLESLRKLPISTIKLDQGVVKNVWSCRKCSAMAWQTPRIARSAGLTTVGEGVEDRPTLDFLRDAGFDEAQGYFISRPLPLDDFLEFCRSGWNPDPPSSHQPQIYIAIEMHLEWRQLMIDELRPGSEVGEQLGRLEMPRRLSAWYESVYQAFAGCAAQSQLDLLYARLRTVCIELLSEDRDKAPSATRRALSQLHRASSEMVGLLLARDAELCSASFDAAPDASEWLRPALASSNPTPVA